MASKKQPSAESSTSTTKGTEKRVRKVLTLSEKIKILDMLKSGMSATKVGRKIGKNESSIRAIKLKEAEIHANVKAEPTIAKRIFVVRDVALVKTEKALNIWLEDMNQKHVPVDGAVLQEKALSLYQHYNKGVNESQRKDFKASKGWLGTLNGTT